MNFGNQMGAELSTLLGSTGIFLSVAGNNIQRAIRNHIYVSKNTHRTRVRNKQEL